MATKSSTCGRSWAAVALPNDRVEVDRASMLSGKPGIAWLPKTDRHARSIAGRAGSIQSFANLRLEPVFSTRREWFPIGKPAKRYSPAMPVKALRFNPVPWLTIVIPLPTDVFPIAVPPSPERKEDISTLVEYFAKRFASKPGKHIQSIAKKTLKLLQSYDWPGTIRKLQNIIGRS